MAGRFLCSKTSGFSDINQKKLAGMNFGAEILWRVGSSVPKHQYFFDHPLLNID
jgi:hypothetical protein